MILKYSSEHEELIFSIRYLSLPLEFIEHNSGIIIETSEGTFSGIQDVLDELQKICKCDPHDLALIDKSAIRSILMINKTPLKSFFKTFFNKQEHKHVENKPSQITIDTYVNKVSLTIADVYLFAKTYRALLEGVNLDEREKKWFYQFQNALDMKITFKKLEEYDFEFLELRVGKILNIRSHEEADKLFIECVSFENEEKTIISGLRSFYSADEMCNKYYIFITNLKKCKLKGVESQGMILCVKDADDLKILESPIDREGITLKIEKKGVDVLQTYKKGILDGNSKQFKTLLSKLKIKNHVLTFDGQPVFVEKSNVISKIKDGDVS